MTRSARWLAALLLTSGPIVTVAAGRQPAATGATVRTTPPAPPAAVPLDLLVDRVWVTEERAPPVSTLYVFLSDHVMVISAAGTPPTVGTWAEDLTGLVITRKGTPAKVDVLELSPTRLRLRINARPATEVTLVPAVGPPGLPSQVTDLNTPAAPLAPSTPTAGAVIPVGSPFRCGADALRVAFEGNAAYITWPDGTSVVLPEMKSAEATPSRRTYGNGQFRVVEDTSESYTRVLFARAGFRPRPCSSTR